MLFSRMYSLSTSVITCAIVARSGTLRSSGSPGIGSPKTRICSSLPVLPEELPPLPSIAESADVGASASGSRCGTSSRANTKASDGWSAEKTILLSFCGVFFAASSDAAGSGAAADACRSTGFPKVSRSSSENSSDDGGRLSGLVESRCSSSRSSRSAAAATYAWMTKSSASLPEMSIA